MELAYSFFVAAAEPSADGRWNALGADFDAIGVQRFPVAVPLTLIAKFWVTPAEVALGRVRLEILSTNPLGEVANPINVAQIDTAPNQRDAAAPTGAIVIVKLIVQLDYPGEYRFTFRANGTTLSGGSSLFAEAIEP